MDMGSIIVEKEDFVNLVEGHGYDLRKTEEGRVERKLEKKGQSMSTGEIQVKMQP
jgi:hypothetical protein